ncbi:origin recognition complex subunit 4 [Lobulomyces angularis]|nr:origin recognition complex subunit 4 [Lobulomyces angularis]
MARSKTCKSKMKTNSKVLNVSQAEVEKVIFSLTSKLASFENIPQTKRNLVLRKSLLTYLEKDESNSVLLMGQSGTGKTTILNNTLFELETIKKVNFPTIIKLSGILQQTDKLALKEVARQLGLESMVEKANLRSFSECFNFILATLTEIEQQDSRRKNVKKAIIKPLVFILEEFELFALQPKQLLLYNLLDAVQSALRPIIVIGLTNRIDAIDLLEKRVKSRFSNRVIHFQQPDSVSSFIEILKFYLSIESSNERQIEKQYLEHFNNEVELLFRNKEMNSLVEQIFNVDNDVPRMLNVMSLPIRCLTTENPFLDVDSIIKSFKEQNFYQMSNVIKDLSLLELCLLICSKKLFDKEIREFNFEMLYEEFEKFTKRYLVKDLKFVKSVVFKVRCNVHYSLYADCIEERVDCGGYLKKWLENA